MQWDFIMARSSIGQDTWFSTKQDGFDSRTSYKTFVMKIIRKLIHDENTESFSVELGESNRLFSFSTDEIVSLNTLIGK